MTQTIGQKLLKNVDFVAAGLCLTFAVAATPALMNNERGAYWMKPYYGSYENAQTIYADARSETLNRLETVLPANQHATASEMDKDALNRFLFEKRGESTEMRQISDLHWHGVTPLRHAEQRRELNKTFGMASGVAFALLGAGFAAGGVARLRRQSKPKKPAAKPH